MDNEKALCSMVLFIDDNSDKHNVRPYQAKLKYAPDALFTWFDWYRDPENVKTLDFILSRTIFPMPFDQRESMLSHFDLEGRYIILGGNSFVIYHRNKAIESIGLLTQKLLFFAKKESISFYLFEADKGNNWLRIVAKKNDIPFIPLEINIFTFGYILVNLPVLYRVGIILLFWRRWGRLHAFLWGQPLIKRFSFFTGCTGLSK